MGERLILRLLCCGAYWGPPAAVPPVAEESREADLEKIMNRHHGNDNLKAIVFRVRDRP
jgi:hypothetical protein